MISFKVTIYSIEARKGRKTTYRVRWVVAGNRFGESFTTKQLAEAYRATLRTAAGNGEGFNTETGLPVSLDRKRRDVSFYQHALEFTGSAWPAVAAKSRVSIIETLARVVPVVVRDLAGAPDPAVLRHALTKKLNQGGHAGELDQDQAKAIGWITRASRPVSVFQDPSVVCDVFDALALNLDGKPAAPAYFSRRRRVLHRVLGYAVRKQRLDKNPLSKGNLPEDWTPPQTPDDAVDPRAVGSPALVASMLTCCSYVGRRQPAVRRVLRLHVLRADAPVRGRRAHTRSLLPARHRMGPPDLRRRQPRAREGLDRRRPGPRAPRPQRPDQGQAHPESPQARPEGPDPARARRAPPHAHPDVRHRPGRAAVPVRKRHPDPAVTWWQVWQKVRAASLTPDQLASPLMKRPYDLRHSGVTWRLNSGVPAAEVAQWAGHSVEMLMRIYARCVAGLEDVWIARMDKTLHPEDQ